MKTVSLEVAKKLKEAMNKDYKLGYLAGIEKAVNLFTFHEKGFGSFCDTGEDMNWRCRSDCTEHGIERCRKHYREIIKTLTNE